MRIIRYILLLIFITLCNKPIIDDVGSTYDEPLSFDEILEPYDIKRSVEKWCKIYKVPSIYVFNILKNESGYGRRNFNPRIISRNGLYIGAMQISMRTAVHINGRLSVNKLKNDVDINIKIGIKLLSVLYKKYGNWEMSIAAYNCGVGRLDYAISNCDNYKECLPESVNIYVSKAVGLYTNPLKDSTDEVIDPIRYNDSSVSRIE